MFLYKETVTIVIRDIYSVTHDQFHIQTHIYRRTLIYEYMQMHIHTHTYTDAHSKRNMYRSTLIKTHTWRHIYTYTVTNSHAQIYRGIFTHIFKGTFCLYLSLSYAHRHTHQTKFFFRRMCCAKSISLKCYWISLYF